MAPFRCTACVVEFYDQDEVLIHILEHQIRIEHTMSQMNADLESKIAGISSDLDQFATATSTALTELKAKIDANPTAPASSLDLTSVDALKAKADTLVSTAQAEATADAPADAPAVPTPSPTPSPNPSPVPNPAPTPSPAVPVDGTTPGSIPNAPVPPPAA